MACISAFNPFDQPISGGQFQRIGKSDHPSPPIDVHTVTFQGIMAMRTTFATIGQPKWAERREPPLAAVAVATEHDINRVILFKQVEHIG